MDKSGRRAAAVVEFLCNEGSVHLFGRECFLSENEDGKVGLCFMASRSRGDSTEKVCLGFDVPFGDFLNAVNEMPEEEWVRVAASLTLLRQANSRK